LLSHAQQQGFELLHKKEQNQWLALQMRKL
jgi:hypothetical protein